MRKAELRRSLTVLAILTSSLVFSLIGISSSTARPPDVSALPDFDYITPVLNALDIDALKTYMKTFSDFGTRFTGYPGCDKAAEYIFNEFSSYGLQNVTYHYFNITVPIDEGAYLTLPTGENVTLYPFLPNMVSPPQTPPGGITGRLVYVGEGNVEDYDGKKIDGSIVLMELNTQYHWLTAAKYGAKAVIFIGPEDTNTMEHRMKVLDTVPYHFPRLYVKANDAERLIKNDGATVNLVSNMKFRQVVSRNVIAYLPGTTYRDKYVLLTASYDSYSHVPSLAPGAREAIGISVVLQLAKYFATHADSNKYTLVFVAFSGTNEGVVGSRWFVRDYVDQNWNTWGKKLALQMNFDLNDVNRFLMPTIDMAWLWGWSEGCGPWVDAYNRWIFTPEGIRADLAKKLNMPELSNDPKAKLVDGRIVREMFGAGGPGHGIVWSDQLGAPYRFGDSEPLANLGGPGFTWHNFLAFEKYALTPFDTPDKILWDNLEYKLMALYPIVYATVNVDLSTLIGAWQPKYAAGIYPKWTDIEGEIDEYNVTRGWYDPVPNALFIYRRPPPSGTYGGSYAGLSSWQVFPWCYTFADKDGKVFAPGLVHAERLGSYEMRAYVLNESTGEITFAPAFGLYWYEGSLGGSQPNRRSSITWQVNLLNVNPQSFGVFTIFKCGNIALFDVGDIYFRNAAQDATAEVTVNNFVSHSPTEQMSWECYIHGGLGVSISTMHVPPNTPLEFMTHTTYTLIYPFSILINSSTKYPYGSGYSVGEGEELTVTHTTLRGAEDWFRLNSERESTMATTGVMPPPRMAETGSLINEAWQAIASNNYSKLESVQNRLLAIEREYYVVLRSTIEDSINAITFFGLILVPFALLFERLLAQIGGAKRVLVIGFSYGLALLVLSYTHPGFRLASNAVMVVVGFLVLVLTSPLLGIMYAAFIDAVKRLREKELGSHWIEMGRTSVAMLSFSVGVLNMRKRRLRTTLTLVSILIITVGVVLFTSMSALKVVSPSEIKTEAPYTGIFVHHWEYSYAAFGEYGGIGGGQAGPQLGERLVEELQVRYGDKAIIAPRSWGYVGQILKGIYLLKENGELQYKIPILAVLGVTPEEANITAPDASLLPGGTWFTEGMDPYVTIIGEPIANDLNVKVGDKIRLGGFAFTIIGIANETVFNSIKDLDGLRYTPMDTRLPGYDGRLYLREIIVIPYKTVLSAFKGLIVNVAMEMKPQYAANQTLIFDMAKEIYLETKIPLYFSSGNIIYTLFPRNVLTVLGWETQLAPLIIASLVAFNLMLGSIEERRRDIFVLSSVGLSPFHIGFLFFAESITYAVLGGVGGYLVSMVIAPLGGTAMRLNPASTAVVIAVTVVMVISLAVTVYPVYSASKMVTPSLERRWRIPKPKGDEWSIDLPFTTAEDTEAQGVLSFIHELVRGHEMPDSEIFRTASPVKYSEEETAESIVRAFTFDSLLSPYELGIAQGTKIMDVKEKAANRHYIQIYLLRKAGPRGPWTTFGREFVDLMRKQILLWRSFTESQRKDYQSRFESLGRQGRSE